MTWSHTLTHHWSDPDATGRRCFVCERACTHALTATHAVTARTERRWYCTNCAARVCSEKGIPFLSSKPGAKNA